MSDSIIEIENILGSKNRIRLIKLFIEKEILPLSYIRKKLRLSHKLLKKYLQTLVKAKIVNEFSASGVKIYELNSENHRVKLLKMLFEEWV